MADAHGNFAVSAVVTAPSPATSGTSLVISAGNGAARFPMTPPYNAVICPAATDPTPSNAEVVRVTARTSDTFTITRAQEGSVARTVVAGDRFYAAITAKTLTDVEAGSSSGSVAPEGVVTGSPGDIYRLNVDQSMAWIKRDSGGTPYGWTGIAEKPYNHRVVYVDGTLGSDTRYDGDSWGTPFRTIQKGIDVANTANGATVMVATGDYTETLTINNTSLWLLGCGGEGVSYGVRLRPPDNTANCINITGSQVFIQNIHTYSTATTWTGIGWNIDNSSLSHFTDCSHRGLDTLTPSLTNGGRGIRITNTEGCLFQRINLSRCAIGLDLQTEGVVNTFQTLRGSINWVDLNMGGNSGGNVFIQAKFTGSGDAGTPSTVVAIGGNGANTFIHCDFSEAGANIVDVSSDDNTFLHQVTAPATTFTVSGNYNTLRNLHVTGAAAVISGQHNTVDQPYLAGSGTQLTFSGSNNILRDESHPTNVSGTGFRRAAHYDSSGNLQGGVSPGNYPFVATHSAPADADVATGQAFLWFDQTNGAAKLMVKAKEAGGTVRTGSVTLS